MRILYREMGRGGGGDFRAVMFKSLGMQGSGSLNSSTTLAVAACETSKPKVFAVPAHSLQSPAPMLVPAPIPMGQGAWAKDKMVIPVKTKESKLLFMANSFNSLKSAQV